MLFTNDTPINLIFLDGVMLQWFSGNVCHSLPTCRKQVPIFVFAFDSAGGCGRLWTATPRILCQQGCGSDSSRGRWPVGPRWFPQSSGGGGGRMTRASCNFLISGEHSHPWIVPPPPLLALPTISEDPISCIKPFLLEICRMVPGFRIKRLGFIRVDTRGLVPPWAPGCNSPCPEGITEGLGGQAPPHPVPAEALMLPLEPTCPDYTAGGSKRLRPGVYANGSRVYPLGSSPPLPPSVRGPGDPAR